MNTARRFGGIFLCSAICLSWLPGCGPKQVGASTVPSATEQAPAPESSETPSAVAAPEPLYEALAAIEREYEAGVELLAAGAEIIGEEAIGLATNRLLATAEECVDTPGCEAQRFFLAYSRLLDRQALALKQQAALITSLETVETDDLGREPGTSPFVTAMPEIERTTSMLRGTDLKEIITLNGPVKAALDDWLTWNRPLLMQSYENYQFLRAEMAPIYDEAGLPEALLFAMLATETGGKVHSYSRAGAAGPLQFMRYTGRLYGLEVVDDFDMRLDPRSATQANVAYLNDRFKEFNDNLEKALAAYNGGESRMRGLDRRLGNISFWDSRFYYALPTETREYVPRIFAAAWLFLHPEDFNLEFPAYESRVSEVVVDRELSLGELTICLGQVGNRDGWFRTLRNLNPRLSPGDPVKAGSAVRMPTMLVPVFEERCGEGQLMTLARELHEANYPEGSELIIYTVRRGDTLGKIASRHRCVSIRELAAINNVRAPRYVIHPGQRLKVPRCG